VEAWSGGRANAGAMPPERRKTARLSRRRTMADVQMRRIPKWLSPRQKLASDPDSRESSPVRHSDEFHAVRPRQQRRKSSRFSIKRTKSSTHASVDLTGIRSVASPFSLTASPSTSTPCTPERDQEVDSTPTSTSAAANASALCSSSSRSPVSRDLHSVSMSTLDLGTAAQSHRIVEDVVASWADGQPLTARQSSLQSTLGEGDSGSAHDGLVHSRSLNDASISAWCSSTSELSSESSLAVLLSPRVSESKKKKSHRSLSHVKGWCAVCVCVCV
jgi:hypothetical protein